MEIHTPRAWHGWREFLKEYFIIVVGVLTALVAEQAVESLRWAERTRETKEHLRAELHLIAVDALTRQAFQPCEREILDTLERALVENGDDWRPPLTITYRGAGGVAVTQEGRWEVPAARAVIVVPEGRWETQAWRNAQADGTANHLSQEDGIAFGRMYELTARMKALSDQEALDVAELNSLVAPQRLDPASRAAYLRLVARVRRSLFFTRLRTGGILDRIGKLNVAKPRLEEYGGEVHIHQAVCSQFHEGRRDIVVD